MIARKIDLRRTPRRAGLNSFLNADRHAANVLPIIREVQRAGARSLRAIAEALNARGVPTARGWQAMTVSNILGVLRGLDASPVGKFLCID
jgi:hypothetical protein